MVLRTTKIEGTKIFGEATFTGKLYPDPEIPSKGDEAGLKTYE